MKPGLGAAAAAALLCVACSSQMQSSAPLSLDYLQDSRMNKRGVTGMPYYLPSTVVPVTVAGDFVLLPGRKKDEASAKDFEYVLTVSIGATKQVADPGSVFMLEYQPEAGTSDSFALSVGANGLLSTVNSTSKDETAAVIVKLAELVKAGAGAVAVLRRPTVTASVPEDGKQEDAEDTRRRLCFETLRKMSVTVEINLSDHIGKDDVISFRPQMHALNRRVAAAMQKVPRDEVNLVQTMELSKIGPKGDGRHPGLASDTTGYAGVLFRLMTPRTFSVEFDSAAKFASGCSLHSDVASLADTPVMIADPNKTFVVDNSRTAFVQKKVNLTVSDGVLLGIDVDKPSELLAAISLPVDVLKVIASIPGEIINVKVKQLTEEKNLSAAQVEMLKLQIDMIKQRQALIDAQNGAAK